MHFAPDSIEKHIANIAKFQEAAGLTPKAQARRWRFQKARTYLDQTSFSLARVAGLCGYSDQSHLTREFR